MRTAIHTRLPLTITSLAMLALASCETTRVELVGQARPAISPDRVQLYLEPPASKYDQIANIAASSRGSFDFTAASKMETVIQRLKIEAAKLGANGILLHGVSDKPAGSIGAGINTETNNPQTADGIGFGASTFLFEKSGDGVAIYVQPP